MLLRIFLPYMVKIQKISSTVELFSFVEFFKKSLNEANSVNVIYFFIGFA